MTFVHTCSFFCKVVAGGGTAVFWGGSSSYSAQRNSGWGIVGHRSNIDCLRALLSKSGQAIRLHHQDCLIGRNLQAKHCMQFVKCFSGAFWPHSYGLSYAVSLLILTIFVAGRMAPLCPAVISALKVRSSDVMFLVMKSSYVLLCSVSLQAHPTSSYPTPQPDQETAVIKCC